MDSGARMDLEVRVVLVSWRAAMRKAQAGELGDTSGLTQGVTVRALMLLERIVEKYGDHPVDEQSYLAQVLGPARAEIHGAIELDAADSGEAAG